MIKASFSKYNLHFKQPAKTSRDTLTTKPTYFLYLTDTEKNITGVGECSTIKGLSIDPVDSYEVKLQELCDYLEKQNSINLFKLDFNLERYPSIKFGLETACLDLLNGGTKTIFKTDFSKGNQRIPINGLVWMGNIEFMKEQVKTKIEQGFDCIKIKIGALGFDEEINLLKSIRKEFSKDDIELRVDANGAFAPIEAYDKLQILSELDIHSIEQPIKQGLLEEMAKLCEKTPIPIALDEELIGIKSKSKKEKVLDIVKPQYIILKPSLVGGIQSSSEWIALAKERGIGWWATSALESNIGLNAIAQWTSTYNLEMPQGLGTGQLYKNNIVSPLTINKGLLYYDHNILWEQIIT